MDGSRFDAWTRRRFGLAAGGLLSSLLALPSFDDAEAKKTHEKRCRKLGQGCTQGGKKKCCPKKGLGCQIFEEGSDARRCCKRGGEPCTEENESQCCSQSCTNGHCDCKSNGMACAADPLCCSLHCVEGTCQ